MRAPRGRRRAFKGLGVAGLVLIATSLRPEPARAGASLTLTPRAETVGGSEGTLVQRGLLRGKSTLSFGPYSFYVEGFGEAEASEQERQRRRLGDGVFLQEAYLEFKLDSFYLRAGKQALRWSEMWVTPSLDVWTARRWNRFLYDPQPEQLEHSGGVSASWAVDGFSVEGAVISEVARSRYPQPFPEFVDEVSPDISGGARIKYDVAGFGLSAVGARVGMKDTGGVALNYAFESWVPKIELGKVHDSSFIPQGAVDDEFVALGVDLFLGSWTFQPQMTAFNFGNGATPGVQSIYYLSGTWQKDRHDFQFQTFGNDTTGDFFLNLFYGYNWKDWLQTSVYVQNYQGRDGALFRVYQEVTGGWVAGVRLEMNVGIGD